MVLMGSQNIDRKMPFSLLRLTNLSDIILELIQDALEQFQQHMHSIFL